MTDYVVMYSGGAGSWAAAKRIMAEDYLAENTVRLLFADTLIEDEELYPFLDASAANVGAPLFKVADGRTPWEIFKHKRWLGNARIAQCSHLLKQVPSRKWMEENARGATVVVGIDWTEAHRMAAIEKHWAPWPVRAPMCEPPYLDKAQVLEWLNREGLKTPRLYSMGFSHNNCGGFCVRAGVGHFANLHKQMPERFKHHEQKEQELREYLQKDVSIMRRMRDGQKYSLTLRQLRGELEAGQDVDWLDVGGCGCWV